MRTLPFLKMHGCGNDFVVMDARAPDLPTAGHPSDVAKALRCADATGFRPNAAQAQAIADRRKGVGFDQLIVLEPSQQAEVFMRILNADGSEAGACGNATRCVADLIMRESGRDAITIQTISGLLPARRELSDEGDEIRVNMGAVQTDWQAIPLAEAADTDALPLSIEGLREPVATNVGNPHCSFFVDDLNEALRDLVGPQIETHPVFPERTNVQLVKVWDRQTIQILIWERGVGPTLASGSSSCATATAAMRRGLTDRSVRVMMPGGIVRIDWLDDGTVDMTGPYSYVYQASLILDDHGLVDTPR